MTPSSKGNGPGGGEPTRHASAGRRQRPHEDPHVQLRVFLLRRQCAGRLIAGGIDGLIAEWERIGDAIADGYPLDTLDDYLNDMDVRNLTHDAIAAVPAALDEERHARLEAADRRVRALVVPARECLWGAEQALLEGWSSSERWWYFMRPVHCGPGLKDELGT